MTAPAAATATAAAFSGDMDMLTMWRGGGLERGRLFEVSKQVGFETQDLLYIFGPSLTDLVQARYKEDVRSIALTSQTNAFGVRDEEVRLQTEKSPTGDCRKIFCSACGER
jgi:hypothetical protein